MADQELPDLTNLAAPAQTDLLYVVADPAGTPVDRKATIKAVVEALILTGGDVTKAAASQLATIANQAVTFAKMQNIATGRLLGRQTAGSGSPEELTPGGGLEIGATPTLRQGMTLQFACSTLAAPADSTTYYFGTPATTVPTTSLPAHPAVAHRTGTIKRVYGYIVVLGTLASGENVTVRINNGTAVSVETIEAIPFSSVLNLFNNDAMTLAVTAGDTLAIRFECPAWATNPTNIYGFATVEIQPT